MSDKQTFEEWCDLVGLDATPTESSLVGQAWTAAQAADRAEIERLRKRVKKVETVVERWSKREVVTMKDDASGIIYYDNSCTNLIGELRAALAGGE